MCRDALSVIHRENWGYHVPRMKSAMGAGVGIFVTSGLGLLGAAIAQEGERANVLYALAGGCAFVAVICGISWFLHGRGQASGRPDGLAINQNPASATAPGKGSFAAASSGGGLIARDIHGDVHLHGASAESPSPVLPQPRLRVFVTPGRPLNWAHLRVENDGPSDDLSARAIILNTGALAVDEAESEYDVPWRRAGYPIETVLNTGIGLDLNLAVAEESDQRPEDGIDAHELAVAVRNWGVPDPPATQVTRIRFQSPSTDRGFFARWVPARYCVGFRLTVSGRNTPARSYLGELIPLPAAGLPLLVSIDPEDSPPFEALAVIAELGDELLTIARDRSTNGQVALDFLEDWCVSVRELVRRRLGRHYVVRMAETLVAPDYTWTNVSLSQATIDRTNSLANDLAWIRRFIAELGAAERSSAASSL